MFLRRAAALLLAVLLAGCTNTPEPSPTTSSASATVSTTPASPSPSTTFPVAAPLTQDLTQGGAKTVVQQMLELTDYRPALKLDITSTEITYTILAADDRPYTLAWSNGTITEVDSDIQYLDQTTFRPLDYPLGNIAQLFDAAERHGATGQDKVLQIVEYHSGQVYMSVTTRPETKTVFFEKDGTPLRNLGVVSVGDLTDGLSAVIAGSRDLVQVGFDEHLGYWADLPPSGGITERRTRASSLPVYSSRRNVTTDWPTFDPAKIDALVLARAIATFSPDGSPCRVEIDNRFKRESPTVRYDCAGKINYTDLAGTQYTEEELREQ